MELKDMKKEDILNSELMGNGIPDLEEEINKLKGQKGSDSESQSESDGGFGFGGNDDGGFGFGGSQDNNDDNIFGGSQDNDDIFGFGQKKKQSEEEED